MGSSALAVIRTSGAGSLEALSRLLSGRADLASAAGGTARVAVIRDGEEEIDQALITVFKAPRSYTGEDGAEISCHGSLPVIGRILSLLSRSGFRAAGPGEFTQRAFLNGKMDLTRAEAVNEIVRAKTDRARSLALQRLSGAVEKRIGEARDALVDLRAGIEVRLDYPEDDSGAEKADAGLLEKARGILRGLTRSYRNGRVFQEGAAAAIAGATNAGKSSLFNALLRQDRAIVSEAHGTTRDFLEGLVAVKGIPVRFIDTAGIRPPADAVEAEGIRRAEGVISGADLVLYLVDAAAGISGADADFLGRRGAPDAPSAPVLRVWNKVDLKGSGPAPEGFIAVSALTGQGLGELEEKIASALLDGGPSETGEPLIDSERQKVLLDRADAALGRFQEGLEAGAALDLAAVDLAEALEALGEITGEVTTAEILERMFSSFCVGK